MRASRIRSFATHAANTFVPRRVPLSRYEPDRFINYEKIEENLSVVRNILKRPLTYSEKIVYGHLDAPEELTKSSFDRGAYLKLRPSRVACQDATAQMALLQFLTASLPSVLTPTTVHCDHLIIAKEGGATDLPRASEINQEVYDFMASACAKHNIGFWKPGAGIIHQIVLENYAYPGGLMIGTDSHTPNAGGLGMAAIGVGGADAVDVMAGIPWELANPKVLGVKLTGKLSGWASPKDIILKLAGLLTVKGATGSIIEYFGPGLEALSCTGMATVANMGAETGATTSVFPHTESMGRFLRATGRGAIADYADSFKFNLQADAHAEYDQVLEIDLSTLEPHINGPFTPDLSIPLSKFKEELAKTSWPQELSVGLVGSCTNSSYEDLSRCTSLMSEAASHGITPKASIIVSPGSDQIRATMERDGQLATFESVGATILANACGPCCGSWDRTDMEKGTPNSIISSYNRNFTGRNDSNPATHAFLASPELVIAMSYAGRMDFNPITDSIIDSEGKKFTFTPPFGVELPPDGYEARETLYQAPPAGGADKVDVVVKPDSERLQLLEPFDAWHGKDFLDCPILIKVAGKCTTDHITTAGPWLKYRGHLENISNNTLIGATNADNGKVNVVVNSLTGAQGSVPEIAKQFKAAEKQFVIVADENYGEGSSREHAALQPRYLNGVAVIAKSFARIHESNLKKQGMLALTFSNKADYDRLTGADAISLVGLAELAPGKPVKMVVTPKSGPSWESILNHTFNNEQIEFFKAGSALNLMRSLQQ
ncbi:aconitase [Pseudohyphozyma bogoriensis]|nr:aconitase [Pseudohyphozyma bogoriensis]